MSYISFTILTSDVAELATRLKTYGLIDADNNPIEGAEYVRLPQREVTVNAGKASLHVFLVKLAHKALLNETKDDAQTNPDGSAKSVLLSTKLGKFIAANSVADAVDGLPARRLGTKLWLVADGDSSHFGVWQ